MSSDTAEKKEQDIDDHHSKMVDHENTVVGQGGKGELECLKEMPVDIILEIFGNLDPIDLLHLLRVSKGLRDMLTSSNAIYLWHLSYSNIQSPCPRPPSCPADTNIICYTRFLYETHCQFCGSDNDVFLHFQALVRFCKDCVWAGFLVESNLSDLCHSQKFKRLRNRRLIVKYESDRCQREKAAAIHNDKLSEYIIHRNTIVLDREWLGPQLRQWKDRFESWRLRKLLVERKRNYIMLNCTRSIRRKLRTEGYGEEVNKYTIASLPHVNETKPLTDFEWKHIRADVMDSLLDLSEMQEIRKLTSRLLVILEWMHITIHNELEIHRCKIPPTVFHIASSQPFLEYIKQDMLGGDLFESQLRKFVTTWRHDMDEYLTSLLPDQSSYNYTTNPRHLLERATTFFTCSNCSEPISYPRILMHDCMIQVPVSGSLAVPDSAQEVTEIAQPLCQHRQPRPRRVIDPICVLADIMQDRRFGINVGKTGVGITFNTAAYNAARRVVLAFGEDPKTVTSVEMEDRNGRIECRCCFHGPQHPPKHRKLVMTWTQAILHDLERHYWKNRPHEAVWRVICSETERGIIDTIEHRRATSERWYQPPACVYQEKFDGLDGLRRHFTQSVDISMHRPPYQVRHSPLNPQLLGSPALILHPLLEGA